MAKRSNPYNEDYIKQSKTHVGLKQFNNNEDRIQKVYEKTLQLLYQGAKKTPHKGLLQCSYVSSTVKKDGKKQLFIGKDGSLLHCGTLDQDKNQQNFLDLVYVLSLPEALVKGHMLAMLFQAEMVAIMECARTVKGSCEENKDIAPEQNMELQYCSCSGYKANSCAYCECSVCAMCQRRCVVCFYLYCSKCSMKGCEGTDICVSCYS